MPAEPTPSPVPAPEELELFQPPRPDTSSHTWGLPDMDMNTGGFVDEKKKWTCDRCANCLACKRRKEGGE